MTSRFLETALTLADLGYPVFPIAPGTKVPLKDSKGHLDATCDQKTIEGWWAEHPNANVAIATREIAVLDVDGEDNQFLYECEDLGNPPLSLTPRGGRHYIYRRPSDKEWRNTEGKIADHVDTRCIGGYILVSPSIAEGKPYQWAPTFPLTVPPNKLPLPPPWLSARLDEIALNGKGKDSKPKPVGNPIPEGQRDSTLYSLGCAMRRSGMTFDEIHAALLQANRDRCIPPLEDDQVRQKADNAAKYEPDQIAVAVVEHHADQDGIPADFGKKKGNLEEVLRQDEDAEDEEDAAEDSCYADPGPHPVKDLRIPGLVSQVMDYTLATAPYPNQTLAFAGALALQAALAGRKVRDTLDNRTNLYLLALAKSGVGKEHPRKVNNLILDGAGLTGYIGNRFASGEAVEDALALNPCKLYQTDEIQNLFTAIRTAKDGRYEALVTAILTMYSSANSIFKVRDKAIKREKEVPATIDQPHLVIFGTSIPKFFYEAISSRFVANGLIARMIVLEADKRGKGQSPDPKSIPQKIRLGAKWWGDFNPAKGNLASIYPGPKVVSPTEEAARLMADCRAEAEEHYNRTEGTEDDAPSAVWARVVEHTHKLALIYAISENPQAPVVGKEAVSWAYRFAFHQARRMLFMMREGMADSPFQVARLKVLRYLRATKNGQLPHHTLLTKMKVDKTTFTNLMNTLVQTDVKVVLKSTKGREARIYQLKNPRGGEGK